MPTLELLFSKSDNPRITPIYVTKDGKYMYYSQLYLDPQNVGRIIKRDLTTGNETILLQKPYLACWQGVYIKKDNKLYIVGEAHDDSGVFRSTLVIVDLATDDVTVVQIPNTDDTNEFIGIAYDEQNDRLIIGERSGGGISDHSSYPDGGGLWTVPRSQVTDPSAWQRVYEFSPLPDGTDNPEVSKIVIVGNQVFVALNDLSQGKGRIAKASLDDLTTWTTVEDISSIITMIDGHGDIIAYTAVSESNNISVKYSTDGGNTWNEIDTGIAVSAIDTTSKMTTILVYGKYAILGIPNTAGAQVHIVDLVDQTTTQVGSMSANGIEHSLGTQRHENVYICNYNYGQSTGTGYIYKLTFDTIRRLSLSVDKEVANLGDTVTLVATLTDGQGNPIQGETIEFYVVRGTTSKDRVLGEKIGSQPTNENGQATINYTLPNTEGKVWFRALYKG